MARTNLRVNLEDLSQDQRHKSKRVDFIERLLRRASAWFLLFLLLQAELGLAWDRQWHDLIGRDSFWIPPHIMMYTGIGAAGLVALGVVLADTLRYYRKAPGVDDDSTVRILWLFHAPIGFIILGFGALVDLVAAPLDNWWHSLYGIDVTLWSPFHLMGTVGGVIEGLGLITIFASELAIERRKELPPRRFLGLSALEWGALMVFTAYMELLLPTLTTFLPLSIDTWQWHILTYPIPLAFLAVFCLLGAANFTHKPGSATLAALLLWLLAVGTQAFVPFALRSFVAMFGLRYRFAGRVPVFNLTIALLPLLFLISALIVDGVVYWQRRGQSAGNALRMVWLLGMLLALPALLIPPSIVQILLKFTSLRYLPAGVSVLAPDWLNTLYTVPLILLTGVIAAVLGAAFGDILYHSEGR